MQESMRNYIMETPDQCQQNIMQAAELTQIITDEFCKQTYKRIQIVASGSSYNAAVTARYFMEKTLKLKVEVLTSFSTLNYETMFDAETFYIGLGPEWKKYQYECRHAENYRSRLFANRPYRKCRKRNEMQLHSNL